jgi:hypothetical protein
MIVWNEALLAHAKALLAETPVGQIQSALDTLSADLGQPVGYEALAKAFTRNGLGALRNHCKPLPVFTGPKTQEPASDSGVCAPLAAPCATPSEKVEAVEPSGQTERILIVPDAHFPFEDKVAWALMLKAARGFKPDHVVVLGDLFDFYTVSFHPKDPTRKVNLEREIEAGSQALRDLEGLGAKRKTLLGGNHEFRLQRYLMEKAPALYGMVKLDEILKLAERGWVHVPYMDHVKIGSVFFSHEFGAHGMNAHRSARQVMNASTAMGHSHRQALEYRSLADGSVCVAAMFGHLIDLSTIDYCHRGQAMAWTLGFGVGHITPDGQTHMYAVPIINGRCVVDGVMYEADPLPDT